MKCECPDHYVDSPPCAEPAEVRVTRFSGKVSRVLNLCEDCTFPSDSNHVKLDVETEKSINKGEYEKENPND